MKDKAFLFRLDEQLSGRLRDYASERHMAISVVIRLAVEEYLNRTKGPTEKVETDEADGADR